MGAWWISVRPIDFPCFTKDSPLRFFVNMSAWLFQISQKWPRRCHLCNIFSQSAILYQYAWFEFLWWHSLQDIRHQYCSHWSSIRYLIFVPRYFYIPTMQRISIASFKIAMYSASVEDSNTLFCAFDGTRVRMKTWPDSSSRVPVDWQADRTKQPIVARVCIHRIPTI